VTLEMLEGLVGRPRAMGWTQVDRQRLLGVWNAIKDGETSVAEAFGEKAAKPLPEPSKATPKLPESPSEPDAIVKAHVLIASITDAMEVDFEADQLAAPNPDHAAAINGLRRGLKVALHAPPRVQKQQPMTQGGAPRPKPYAMPYAWEAASRCRSSGATWNGYGGLACNTTTSRRHAATFKPALTHCWRKGGRRRWGSCGWWRLLSLRWQISERRKPHCSKEIRIADAVTADPQKQEVICM